MYKKIEFFFFIALLAGAIFVNVKLGEYVASDNIEIQKNVIVLDPGHGGADPGKVGVNGALEKDINLAIALRLKELLEQQDVKVVMTREDDQGTYPQTGSNRKVRDMQKRVEIINKEQPALTVSIHQNSFPDQSVSGAQTFYFDIY